MTRYEYAGVAQLRRLLDAVMEVGSELRLPVVLRRIIEAATDLAGARFGALGVLDVAGTRLAEFITVGIDQHEAARIGHLPEGHGILGLLITDPRPLRLPDLTAHPDSFGFPPNHPPMTSFLGVPLLLRDEVFGNLYLTDKIDGDVFTDVDEELVVALAAAAGLAIENARLHQHAAEVALLEERERIAQDLHDDVIQRLFAAGLGLESTAQMTTQRAVRDRLEQTVADIDVTIRQVRNTIFRLHHQPVDEPRVRSDVIGVCTQATPALGFDPLCQIQGPVDTAVSSDVASHLILALREGLSNVARHAQATKVDVFVSVADGALRLEVTDDGIGVPPAAIGRGSGLGNLARRAEGLGGTCTIGPASGGGTTMVWSVPLDPRVPGIGD